MSEETACRAVDLFFSQSFPEGIPPQFCFFGGEPLLRWDLITKCIDYAERQSEETGKPFRLAINTNGLLLDYAKASYLQSRAVDTILSFDGVRQAQDASRPFRNGESSFDHTHKALRILLDVLETPAVCTVISPENVRHLPASVDFLLDEGVRRLMLNPNFFAEWNEKQRDWWVRGYEHAAERLEQAYRQNVVLNINLFTAKIITHLRGGYDTCDCCLFGLNKIAIAPSGRIYPCQRMVGEDEQSLLLLGNVFDGMDIEATKAIEACHTADSTACSECEIRHRCRNWCSCVNYALTGDFRQPGELICFHEQTVVKLADVVASNLFADKNKTFMDTFYLEEHFASEWI